MVVPDLTKIIKGAVTTKIVNPSPSTQRRNRRELRQQRAERSKQAQDAVWQARFAAATTPQELLGVAHDLLRARLTQLERKAAKSLDVAHTDEQKAAARRRYEDVQATVERVCGDAADYLAKTADQLDTTRR